MVKQQTTKLKRPTADNPQIGMARYNMIKEAMEQYKRAMDAGFYIEAIALMESAICDRLESLANIAFSPDDYSYSTIGQLVHLFRSKGKPITPELANVLDALSAWAKNRNNAIHEMVKLGPTNSNIGFVEKYKSLKQIAKQGKDLFNAVKKEYKKNVALWDDLKTTNSSPVP